MRCYAQSRAAHKQIPVSHMAGNSIKISQGVTANNYEQEGAKGEPAQVTTDSRKSTELESDFILNSPSENVGKSITNPDYSPEIT